MALKPIYENKIDKNATERSTKGIPRNREKKHGFAARRIRNSDLDSDTEYLRADDYVERRDKRNRRTG